MSVFQAFTKRVDGCNASICAIEDPNPLVTSTFGEDCLESLRLCGPETPVVLLLKEWAIDFQQFQKLSIKRGLYRPDCDEPVVSAPVRSVKRCCTIQCVRVSLITPPT
jgi:hypothetical protein